MATSISSLVDYYSCKGIHTLFTNQLQKILVFSGKKWYNKTIK